MVVLGWLRWKISSVGSSVGRPIGGMCERCWSWAHERVSIIRRTSGRISMSPSLLRRLLATWRRWIGSTRSARCGSPSPTRRVLLATCCSRGGWTPVSRRCLMPRCVRFRTCSSCEPGSRACFGSSRGRSVARSTGRSTRSLRTVAEVSDCSSIRMGWVRACSRCCPTVRSPGRCPPPSSSAPQ